MGDIRGHLGDLGDLGDFGGFGEPRAACSAPGGAAWGGAAWGGAAALWALSVPSIFLRSLFPSPPPMPPMPPMLMPNVLLSFLTSEVRRVGVGGVDGDGDVGSVGDGGCVDHCVGELAALSDDNFLTATATTTSGGGIDTVSGGGGDVGGATRPTSRLALLVEYTDGVSAMSSDNDINFVLTGSSAYSSRRVTVDEVGAPESRFLSGPCRRGVTLGLRNSGCCSCGGAGVGGGMTTMGDDLGLGLEVVEAVEALRVVEAVQAVQLVRAVEVVIVDGVRVMVMRRGFRGGGRGIGGSACLVCSYRSATKLLSSRKGVRRVAPVGFPELRKLANF